MLAFFFGLSVFGYTSGVVAFVFVSQVQHDMVFQTKFGLRIQIGAHDMAFEISLAGKMAVITGSNSGIGLGMAWEIAQAGADVVLNSFLTAMKIMQLLKKSQKPQVQTHAIFRLTCPKVINVVV